MVLGLLPYGRDGCSHASEVSPGKFSSECTHSRLDQYRKPLDVYRIADSIPEGKSKHENHSIIRKQKDGQTYSIAESERTVLRRKSE
jgi:hypothetical protein